MKPDSDLDKKPAAVDPAEDSAEHADGEHCAVSPAATPTGLEEESSVEIEFINDEPVETAGLAVRPVAAETEPEAADADDGSGAAADKQRIASLTRLVARGRFEMDHFQGEIEELKKDRDKLQREAREHAELLEKRQLDSAAQRAQMTKKLEDQQRDGAVPLLKDLMVVVDHLDFALRTCPPEDPLFQGIEMTRSELIGILKRNGAEPIEAVGTPFNPRWHEATAAEYREDIQVDTVIDDQRRGWQRGGKVLRPTMVRVGKPAEKKA